MRGDWLPVGINDAGRDEILLAVPRAGGGESVRGPGAERATRPASEGGDGHRGSRQRQGALHEVVPRRGPGSEGGRVVAPLPHRRVMGARRTGGGGSCRVDGGSDGLDGSGLGPASGYPELRLKFHAPVSPLQVNVEAMDLPDCDVVPLMAHDTSVTSRSTVNSRDTSG